MSRLSKEVSDSLKRGQKWLCGNRKCGKSIKSGGQIHHKDGNRDNHDLRNLIALCKKCHQEENAKQAKLRKQGKEVRFPVSFKI